MSKLWLLLSALTFLISTSSLLTEKQGRAIDEPKFISYEMDPTQQELKFYWKDKHGANYQNFQRLKANLEKESKELVFAMNGGMYNQDRSPQGLYIENGQLKSPLDTVQSGYGNFYLQPNGVFYLTDDNKPAVSTSQAFINRQNIRYATQSGPMLVIDGEVHPKFIKGSQNIHIRNGVGILPNGNILFAISRSKVNFFDFATFFKQKGCENALYLDGFVSRVYLPSKSVKQLDGSFGVIIAETKSKTN
ncbi:phosphodiester glycosidase family protein [Fulvivirga sp. 29W222]|uniref:Phosphodiester glycosidase family protein n=1 Tax=Fulvivirga marina TaxID=2494733 RepID=A0A937KBC2_9BACT|nr:phosphodiester glycosidase family protein [Fulvivirga marina]MBL6445892.1 phosphodiester glycosidase family protein [Fulvivirga marina]